MTSTQSDRRSDDRQDQRGQYQDDRNSKQTPDRCEPVGYKREHVRSRSNVAVLPAHADRSSPLGSPLRPETATYLAGDHELLDSG
jgi:hypothetical protein